MTKNLLIVAVLCAFSGTLFAADAVSTSGSTASAGNSGQGNGNTVSAPVNVNVDLSSLGTQKDSTKITVDNTGDSTTRVLYSGSQTIRNVPSVSGPPLISSNDTCMGSASGSVVGPGFGVSMGKTYTDTNCVTLKNSRELWNMGMRAAALALMCKDEDNKDALEVTGFICPVKQQSSAVQSEQYTDPIVRARLGMPALEMKGK